MRPPRLTPCLAAACRAAVPRGAWAIAFRQPRRTLRPSPPTVSPPCAIGPPRAACPGSRPWPPIAPMVLLCSALCRRRHKQGGERIWAACMQRRADYLGWYLRCALARHSGQHRRLGPTVRRLAQPAAQKEAAHRMTKGWHGRSQALRALTARWASRGARSSGASAAGRAWPTAPCWEVRE